MKIILEGPDGCGKSTLAEELLSNFIDMPRASFKLSDETPIGLEVYNDILTLTHQNLVSDRFNLSEEVYSHIYKREPKDSFLDHLKVFNKVKEEGAYYFILVSSNFDVLLNRLTSRGDTEKVYENIRKINDYYLGIAKELVKIYPDNVFILDISEIDDLYAEVVNIIKSKESKHE